MQGQELQRLFMVLSRLPGIGPRSARRLLLYLLKRKDRVIPPLLQALNEAYSKTVTCSTCYSLDTQNPCTLCEDPRRDPKLLCVVPDILDLWSFERPKMYRGYYHVLGGVLSAMDGVGPENLRIQELLHKLRQGTVQELILAIAPTLDGQTTLHYILEHVKPFPVKTTTLAHGIPLGGELDFLDEATLSTAFSGRRRLI